MKKLHVFTCVLLCVSLLHFYNSMGMSSKGTTKDSVNMLITRDTLKNITIGLELYRREFGEYPQTLDEFLMRKGITDKDITKDGWGNPLYYVRANDSYTLLSKGRDGKAFTDDDVHTEH